MFKKSTRLTLEVLMALVTAVLLVLAVFLWRLSEGPMEVPFLNRHLQSSLSDFSDDVDITINQTVLQWGGFEHPLSVHTLGVKALNKIGGEIAAVSEVSLDLSLPDLLIGRFVPTHINIMKPSLTVTRDENGRFDINVKSKQAIEEAQKQNVGDDPLKEILDLISDPQRQGVARKLTSFTITNSEIFYQDIPNDFTLISPRSDIELVRDKNGIEGVITLNVNIADRAKALRGQVDYNFESQKTTVSLGINDFNPSVLADLSKNFEKARHFDAPLNGTLEIALNNLFQILSFNLIATGEAGKINIPQIYEMPLEIDGAALDVSYNPSNGSVFMKQLAIDLDGFKIDVQGRLTQEIEQGIVSLEAKAGIFNIGVDQLPKYWPEGLARGARRWITKNISDGHVSKATADLKVSAPITDFTLLDIESLTGNIFFEKASVDYLNPMPPVKGIDGVANFTKDQFNVEVKSGGVRGTVLEKGLVTINNLGKKPADIEIDLAVAGPLSDGLYLLAHKPLELTKEMGLDPEGFSGQAATNLYLTFPLVKNLQKSQVKLKASSLMSNVKGEGIISHLAVTSDQLEMAADKTQMTIKGKAILADIPIDLDWVEKFGSEATYTRQMKATAQISPANVKTLTGLDISEFIISPFQATATIQENQAGEKATVLDLDLKNTAVTIPMIEYQKMAGQSARARFDVIGASDGTVLKNINLEGPDLSVKGQMSFANSTLQSFDFSEFKNNGTDAQITALKENDRYKITVKGNALDVRQLWEKSRNKKTSPDDQKKDKYPSVALAANVKEMKLVDGHSFQNVKAAVDLYPNHVNRMELDARAGNGDVYLRYTPFQSGKGYQLRFETPDAGMALKAFGLTNKISGGMMIVDAATAVNEPDLIVGGLTIKDYKIVKAPVLGRLLNAMSPVGLIELLNSDGIKFLALESKWYYKNDILNFQTGRMAGGALGLNYDGSINLETNYMDIKGTVVPVDPVNRVIGALPVVGTILGGKNGDGLFAATYTIKGSTEDPKVTVNPLAALAPGILRSIFFENGL